MTNRKNRPQQIVEQDRIILQDLIEKWGGINKFGARLGFNPKESSTKLNEWLRNGVPDHFKVKFPEMFMPHLFEGDYPYPKRKREPEKD